MRKMIFIVICVLYLGLNINRVNAVDKKAVAEASAIINYKVEIKKEDIRISKVKSYLKGYPLEENSEDFIQIADKYGLDKHAYLVAAIAGVESTFGKFIPYGSYNAWGFGIPTGAQSGITFNSWKEGIEEVTKTIRTGYLKNVKNTDDLSVEELVYSIGPIYAASPTWADKVMYFMNKLEETSVAADEVDNLPLSI